MPCRSTKKVVGDSVVKTLPPAHALWLCKGIIASSISEDKRATDDGCEVGLHRYLSLSKVGSQVHRSRINIACQWALSGDKETWGNAP